MSKVEHKTPVEETQEIKIEFIGSIEKKDEVATIKVEADNFYKYCPVPEKTVKQYMGYVREYNMAVADAATTLAAKEFNADSSIKNIVVASTMGTHKDRLMTNVQKNKDYPAIGGREAFSQPYIRQTVRSSNMVNKTNLKNLTKTLQESL